MKQKDIKGVISRFYQKRTSAAPTTGNLWIEVLYADGGV